MKDLRGLVLDCLHLHQVRGVFTLTIADGLLYPMETVCGQMIVARAKELIDLRHEGLTTGEDAGHEPHELPTTLLA